ncbi:hypothetical protein AB0C24_24375 [Amycolatopsis japonica]|uniref:hypothetical protein n=1 Tax=Amycolatopsis japonica TaxID=208439 RepID=UPI0033E79EB9
MNLRRLSKAARPGQCLGGGWILGHRMDGVQAEFVRVPFADVHLPPAERRRDEAALMPADIMPTSYEVGARNGKVQPGDCVANVGVHGAPATLHLENLWIRDITITTGLVDTSSTSMPLRMLAAGRLDTTRFITHRFGLDDMDEAYDVFARPQESDALKVALFRSGHADVHDAVEPAG